MAQVFALGRPYVNPKGDLTIARIDGEPIETLTTAVVRRESSAAKAPTAATGTKIT